MTHITQVAIQSIMQATRDVMTEAMQTFHASSDALMDNLYSLNRSAEELDGFDDSMTLTVARRETFFGPYAEDRVSLVLLETGTVFVGQAASAFLGAYQIGAPVAA